MKPRHLLFQADPEALGGNGPAAPAAVAAPVAENVIPLPTAAAPVETPAAAVPVEQEQKGGFLQGVLASISSKADLLQQITAEKARAEQALTQVGSLQAELTTAQQSVTTLQAEIATLKNERQQIEQALQAAQGAVQGEQKAAAKIVATMGFEAEQLPAAQGSLPETKESLQARIAAETNTAKRHELALQLLEMD